MFYFVQAHRHAGDELMMVEMVRRRGNLRHPSTLLMDADIEGVFFHAGQQAADLHQFDTASLRVEAAASASEYASKAALVGFSAGYAKAVLLYLEQTTHHNHSKLASLAEKIVSETLQVPRTNTESDGTSGDGGATLVRRLRSLLAPRRSASTTSSELFF